MAGAVLAAGAGVRGAARRARRASWSGRSTPRWPRPGSIPPKQPGIITPFMVLYALHDAMVKPMPEGPLTPGLAELWSVSEDGLTVDFVLRAGAKFHNGDPVTADDVKFSFERYRGASHETMKTRVASVEAPDPGARPVQIERAVARLSDLLFERDRRGLDRPPEICREGRRSRLQASADRGRPVQVRFVHARRRAGPRSIRSVLAQAAQRQAPGLQGYPRRDDAARGPEGQRGRYRLLDPRRAGRGHPADAGAHPQADGRLGPVLGLFPGAMGPQIAVARCPGQAGREPRDQPREHQPRPDARPLASDRQRDAGEPRILLAAAEAGFRPGKRPAAAGRSGLQERLRRGRVLSATPPTPIWARRSSTIFRRPASGRGCARSNAPPSSRAMPRRSSTKA